MKVKEIRELSDEEITAEVERRRGSRVDLRSQAVTEKLEDPATLGKSKRDIARILTVQRERQLAQQAQDEGKET